MIFHKTTFEDFLADKHADQYYGTDDMMPDDLVDWINNLSVDELIEFADEFIKHFIDKRIVEEEIDKRIEIHKELETQFVGKIEDIKNGVKTDNPHIFVIEQIQDLKHALLKDKL